MPQITRDDVLRDDHRRMLALQSASQGRLTFTAEPPALPQAYHIVMRCKGVRQRPDGQIKEIVEHRLSVYLGPTYPSQPPDLVWETPIFHPNVLQGHVCLLAGLWHRDLRLDEVCCMLWDVARYWIYTPDNPLHQEAKVWAGQQPRGVFPLDSQSLRAFL